MSDIAPPHPAAPPNGKGNGNGSSRGYDRVPPHSLEAEVSVLGAAMLSPDAAGEVLEDLIPDDFYRNAHRAVFEAIQALATDSIEVDAVTVLDWLRTRNRLDEVGGATAIHSLTAAVPTAANASHYARIVKEKSLLRRLIEAGTSVARMGYEPTDDAISVVDRAESLIYEVAETGSTSQYSELKDLLNTSFEHIEKLAENRSEVTGLATGFNDLDRLTAGLQRQNLVVIAARPAMGKCLRADATLTQSDGSRVTIGEAVAAGRAGKPVHPISLDATLRLAPTRATEFHDNGLHTTFAIRTRLGRSTRATANHPFLTPRGWAELGDLRPGDLIAVPRHLAVFGSDRIADGQVELLGDLLAEDIPRDAAGVEAAPTGRGEDFLASWLKELGLWGCGSHDKFVPDPIFRAPKDQVATFLSRLFAAGGSAWVADHDGYFGISYSSGSERLIRDVQHLLLRFGIIARIRAKQAESEGARRLTYELEVGDAENALRFLDEIGIFANEDACDRVRAAAEAHDQRPALDSDELHRWANSDVYWDEVVSIEEYGEEPVYDLTVPELHNFVADDLIVHNSSLATGIAHYVAVDLQKPVIMFNLEMSKLEIVNRLLSSEAMIDSKKIKTGRLDDADWRKLGDALGRLSGAPLFIDDTPSITLMEIRAKCRRLKQKRGLELVVVDYLQLMQSHKRVENRVQEVGEISRGLKMLAKELDVPVVALSQLSRQPENRTDKRPQLADLRESGSIEQDSDIVAFIYRDEVYDEDSPDRGIAELIVSKHRNGPTGTVKLAFLNHVTKFANLSRGGVTAGGGGTPPPAAPPPGTGGPPTPV